MPGPSSVPITQALRVRGGGRCVVRRGGNRKIEGESQEDHRGAQVRDRHAVLAARRVCSAPSLRGPRCAGRGVCVRPEPGKRSDIAWRCRRVKRPARRPLPAGAAEGLCWAQRAAPGTAIATRGSGKAQLDRTHSLAEGVPASRRRVRVVEQSMALRGVRWDRGRWDAWRRHKKRECAGLERPIMHVKRATEHRPATRPRCGGIGPPEEQGHTRGQESSWRRWDTSVSEPPSTASPEAAVIATARTLAGAGGTLRPASTRAESTDAHLDT